MVGMVTYGMVWWYHTVILPHIPLLSRVLLVVEDMSYL